MKKVIHMVTKAGSLNLMNGQIEYLQKNGYNIGVISSSGKHLEKQSSDFKKTIEMKREVSIIEDFKSLIKIIKYLRKEKPDIINAGTPKAGLLGIVAGFIARVPNRIYTMRGLRLETETGIFKKILWLTEKISCKFATEVICISPSLLKKSKDFRLLKKKGIILNKGSSNGLDINKYPLSEDKKVIKFKNDFKKKYKIKESDFILGFVGRLTKDKGIYELVKVFNELEKEHNDIKLIILGGVEKGLDDSVLSWIKENSNIIHLGYKTNPEYYYYLFNVLTFPTYREGFGNVSIQAQAASVPVITTNVTGAKDTIIENKTGILCDVESEKSLKESILLFYQNRQKAVKYGENGREFVIENFQQETIWESLNSLYQTM